VKPAVTQVSPARKSTSASGRGYSIGGAGLTGKAAPGQMQTGLLVEFSSLGDEPGLRQRTHAPRPDREDERRAVKSFKRSSVSEPD
jgi:hypothetical protein